MLCVCPRRFCRKTWFAYRAASAGKGDSIGLIIKKSCSPQDKVLTYLQMWVPAGSEKQNSALF